jgi:hypothetical protein
VNDENDNDEQNYVLEGRVNIGVETDEFVETLTDKVLEEYKIIAT